MNDSTSESWGKLKRIGRFLQNRPRLVWKYPWQDPQDFLDVYADAGYAGCKVSRKSTSGGCIMIGYHLLRTWCKTQGIVSLSSAEAELMAATKGGCEGLGMMRLFQDMGMNAKARLHVDASAAIGIIQRRGVGKVRHLDVHTLWLQEREARRHFEVLKIQGSKNPADLFTKGLSEDVMLQHLTFMGLEYREGRAEKANKLMSVMGQSVSSSILKRAKEAKMERRKAAAKISSKNGERKTLKRGGGG